MDLNLDIISLADICTIKHGYGFKGEYYSDLPTKNILLTPGNFKIGGGFKKDKLKYYDGPINDEFILKPYDLIVSMTDLSKDGDTLGFSALIPDDDDLIYLHNQRIGLVEIIDESIVDKSFLYWLLRNKEYQHFVVATSTGSTVKHTSPKSILKYEFKLPTLKEQKNIGNILNYLENKIKLNENIINNLNKLIDLNFKDNLLNFNKYSEDELISSEFGPIPKGWKVSTLTEIANYQNGLAMQKFAPENPDDAFRVLKIRELRQGFLDKGSNLCSKNIKEDCIVYDGDIIFSWSGSLLVDIWAGGTCGLNQHLFKVTSHSFDKWFYYCWTKFYLNQFILIAKDKATTMGHIKRQNLEESLVLIPDKKTYQKLTNMLQPMIEHIIKSKIEIKRLQQLIDVLLPKLMSNEINVSRINL